MARHSESEGGRPGAVDHAGRAVRDTRALFRCRHRVQLGHEPTTQAPIPTHSVEVGAEALSSVDADVKNELCTFVDAGRRRVALDLAGLVITDGEPRWPTCQAYVPGCWFSTTVGLGIGLAGGGVHPVNTASGKSTAVNAMASQGRPTPYPLGLVRTSTTSIA